MWYMLYYFWSRTTEWSVFDTYIKASQEVMLFDTWSIFVWLFPRNENIFEIHSTYFCSQRRDPTHHRLWRQTDNRGVSRGNHHHVCPGKCHKKSPAQSLNTWRRLIRDLLEVTKRPKKSKAHVFSSDKDNKASCVAARPEGRKTKLLFNSLQDTSSIVWACLLCNPPSKLLWARLHPPARLVISVLTFLSSESAGKMEKCQESSI